MADNRSVQISAAAFAKLHQVSTATLTTQLLNRGFHNTFLQLHLLGPDKQMVGYAFTLRYVPMREDLIDTQYDNRVNVQRIAVESATKDDVLIIDARGFFWTHPGDPLARQGRFGVNHRWRFAGYTGI